MATAKGPAPGLAGVILKRRLCWRTSVPFTSLMGAAPLDSTSDD
jgi:hypothetical protein